MKLTTLILTTALLVISMGTSRADLTTYLGGGMWLSSNGLTIDLGNGMYLTPDPPPPAPRYQISPPTPYIPLGVMDAVIPATPRVPVAPVVPVAPAAPPAPTIDPALITSGLEINRVDPTHISMAGCVRNQSDYTITSITVDVQITQGGHMLYRARQVITVHMTPHVYYPLPTVTLDIPAQVGQLYWTSNDIQTTAVITSATRQ